MIRTSHPVSNESSIERSASRSRRLTRLRVTALPIRRPVARPNRVLSRSVRRTLTARRGCDRLVPRSWIVVKSLGLESITRRGRTGPRLVRRRGACDRERGVRRGCGGRPSSSSGPESRAPWRGGASLADRSASSELRAILSIRPRGNPVGVRPGRHTNAPAHRSAERVRRPGDDRSGPPRVSNEVSDASGRRRGARARSLGPAGRRSTEQASSGAVRRYSHGVSRNRLATARWAVLSFADPLRRDARATHPKPSGTWATAPIRTLQGTTPASRSRPPRYSFQRM